MKLYWQGFDNNWVNSILRSPRAGVFLNLCSSQEQPTVDFFVRLNIPVWYPWGSAEETCARQNPSYWEKYIPPAHLLQRARSFLTAVPGPAPPAAEGSQEDNQPWRLFFAESCSLCNRTYAQEKAPYEGISLGKR